MRKSFSKNHLLRSLKTTKVLYARLAQLVIFEILGMGMAFGGEVQNQGVSLFLFHVRFVSKFHGISIPGCQEVAGLKRHDCDHAIPLIRFLAAYRSCEGERSGNGRGSKHKPQRGQNLYQNFTCHISSDLWYLHVICNISHPANVGCQRFDSCCTMVSVLHVFSCRLHSGRTGEAH